MITRTWHGRTSPENGDQYLAFLLEEGTRDYLKTAGNLSVKVWRKKDEAFCHFWTVTEWKDIASVKSFAGEAYERARYYPQDKDILLELEETVNHYECVDVSSTKCRDYVRQLDQLYQGGSWQGESYLGKLEDVDEGLAFSQPVTGVHSVAEILWHCIYWRRVTIKRLEGDYRYRDATIEQYNFLPLEDLKKRGWESLKRELEETQIVLQKILLINNDNFLKQEYASGYTYDYQVEGCIHHDVYHLGQIGLVKKILSVRSRNT